MASFSWGLVAGLGLGLAAVWALELELGREELVSSVELSQVDELVAENARLRRRLMEGGPRLSASRVGPAPSEPRPTSTTVPARIEMQGLGPNIRRNTDARDFPPDVPAHLRGTVEMWISALRRADAKGNQRLCAYLEKALGALGPDASDALRALALDSDEPGSLRARALRALGQVSPEQLGTSVEEILRREPSESPLFQEALQALAANHPSSVPTAVVQLAQDPNAEPGIRGHALRAVMEAEPEVAASIFRLLLRDADEPARLNAYRILSQATRPELAPLLQEILRDTPGKATSGLIPALALMKGPAWSNVQMTGPPDTPSAGDSATAWASKKAQDGLVTVELDYQTEVTPEQVRVHETLSAGAIVRVEVRKRDGTWTTLWTGSAQAANTPRWFAPALAPLPARIRTLRLTLDTDKISNWNEIDAVELVGDGLRQWATGARSSSCYAGS